MDIDTIRLAKELLAAVTHLSKDALHVHVGLLLYASGWVLFPQARRTAWLLVPVIVAAIAGEVVDGIDDVAKYGHWVWRASLKDVVSTVLWPALIVAAQHLRRAGAADLAVLTARAREGRP